MLIEELTKDVRAEAQFAHLNKNDSIEQYEQEVAEGHFDTDKVKVTHHVRLNTTEWNEFTHSFFTDQDWLAGKGWFDSDFETKYNLENQRGTAALFNDKEEMEQYRAKLYRLCLLFENVETGASVYVDPQGYKYARYVGLPLGSDVRLAAKFVEKEDTDEMVEPRPSGVGTLITDIKDRDSVRHGQVISGRTEKGMNAEIVKGKSVRLFGVHCDRAYDITFKVGDECVYDAYNYVFLGTIKSITHKTVTVVSDHKTKRLSIYQFNHYNWNYDADRIAKRNAETSMCI